MKTECSVIGCGNRSDGTKTFFKFPMASESFDMCMKWVQNTGNQKLLQDFSLEGAQLMGESICSDHFSDKDFTVFGKVQSGLKADAVPIVVKIETESKYMSKPKKKKHKETKSSTDDPLPLITIIKEEPHLSDEIEDILPCPLVNKEDKYIMSDPSLKTPKIEQVDIDEALLPDTYKDNDERMEMETDDDQFEDLPENSDFDEHIDDPSVLLDIADVEYLSGQKGKSFAQRRRDAMRQARARQRETPEQRALRLEKTRVRAQERRKEESEVQTTIRRYKSAVRAAVKRSDETDEEKKIRQEKNKIRAAERRKNMTPKERTEWRERNRIQTRERRQKESDIKKIVRRYNNAIRAPMKRSSETPEQRMERRLKDALRAAERRKMETPEERQERLRKDRERITLRRLQMLISETPEQREARLKKERDRMYRKRHGLKGDLSTETSNDGTDSQQDSEDYDISAVLSMYPPSIEIQTLDDGQSGNAARTLT